MLTSALQKCDTWSIISGCLSDPVKRYTALRISREVFVYGSSLHISRHASLLMKRRYICPYLLCSVIQWTENSSQSQCLWLPAVGPGPGFLMPRGIESQCITQHVEHSFCWWTRDLVNWKATIYFTNDGRCWAKHPRGSNLMQILGEFILCLLNLIWVEICLHFFFFLPSLQTIQFFFLFWMFSSRSSVTCLIAGWGIHIFFLLGHISQIVRIDLIFL